MSSAVDSCSTVEELDQVFSKKLSLVRDSIKLRGLDADSANELRSLEVEIRDLRELFKEIRDLIKSGKEKVYELQKLLKKLEQLNKRLDHMKENFPAVLKPAVPVPEKEMNGKVLDKESLPAASSKSNKTTGKMQLITIQEFENVPKYMKGRLKYEQINKFVNEFNIAVEGKYKLLSMPRKELKPVQLKVWQKLKSQETAETKGLFFCTADDLKTYGNIKLDKASINMMTILRHCGKVKEIRGPGPIIRYTIM